MFRHFLCVACVAATPAFSQTASDDQPSTENWWDRVGSGFFSDEGLTLLRPEPEIRAHWTALSSDDQAAVLERCAILMNQAGTPDTGGVSVPSEQLGSNTELGEAPSDGSATGDQAGSVLQGDNVELPADEGTLRADAAGPANETSVTGAVDGAEVHSPGDDVPADTGLAGGVSPEDAQLRPVCSVIAGI
jgi:hypothetical protein